MGRSPSTPLRASRASLSPQGYRTLFAADASTQIAWRHTAGSLQQEIPERMILTTGTVEIGSPGSNLSH